MKRWEYELTTDMVLDSLNGISDEDRRVVLCDATGRCFFHERRETEIRAIQGILNRRGKEGWELVQFEGHERTIHCIWKREMDAASI